MKYRSIMVNVFAGFSDSPKGYGVRLEYLGIELTKAEQISFLSTHLDLKQNFDEIKAALAALNKVTTKLAGEIYSKDVKDTKLSTLPIAGVKFTSRLSIEDLLALHQSVMEITQGGKYHNLLGFRKVEVWIGSPGADKKQADFIPSPPDTIPTLIYNLLEWWRGEYMKVIYDLEEAQITVIALFHEKFLSIHPFLDGNGRIARILASLQFKDLLDKIVIFDRIERADYYQALQKSREGNKQDLNDIFRALIKE